MTSMSEKEQKAAKKYLQYLNNSPNNKQIALFMLLKRHPDKEEQYFSQKIYKTSKNRQIRALTDSLLENLLDFLVLRQSVESNSSLDERVRIRLEIWRNFMYFSVAMRKKQVDLATEYLKKGIDLAKTYHYDFEELYFYLLNLNDLLDGNNQMIISRIKDLIYQFKMKAEIYLEKAIFISKITGRVGNLSEMVYEYEPKISELKRRIEGLESPFPDYYLSSMEFEYRVLQNDFEKAYEAASRMLSLSEKHPNFLTQLNLSNVYFAVARTALSSLRFSESIRRFDQTLELVPEYNTNFFAYTSFKAIAHYYLGEIETAIKTVKKLLENNESLIYKKQDLEMAKFFLASYYFADRQYDKALKLIYTVDGLKYDKEGWISDMKIFEIQILVEQEEIALLQNKLDALRKHLKRYSIDKKDRRNLIYRIMNRLEQKSLNFTFLDEEPDLLENLKEQSWGFFSSELIKVDFWLECKRNNVDFYTEFIQKLKNEAK